MTEYQNNQVNNNHISIQNNKINYSDINRGSSKKGLSKYPAKTNKIFLKKIEKNKKIFKMKSENKINQNVKFFDNKSFNGNVIRSLKNKINQKKKLLIHSMNKQVKSFLDSSIE